MVVSGQDEVNDSLYELIGKVTLLDGSLVEKKKEFVEAWEALTSSSLKLEELNFYLHKEKDGYTYDVKTC